MLHKVEHWIKAKIRPATSSQFLETASDLMRSRSELVVENALLRQQPIVLKRSVKLTKLTRHNRWLMVLLKLVLHVSKSVIQKYLHQVQPPRASGQTWSTFLHNQAEAVWACDFIQITDVFCLSIFAFVIVELGSRRVVQLGVTRHPSDE